MWSRSFRAPALRWVTARTIRTRPAPRGPRNTLRRRDFPPPISESKKGPSSEGQQPGSQPSTDALSSALRDANPSDNSLLSPVYVPEDPNGVLKERHPAAGLLANSALVVQRQLEVMNVMLGFEQANRYVIMDASGNHVGYMAEQERGMGSMMARQWFRTHRSFVTHVFDKYENEVLRFHRPFSWINSHIRVYDPLEVADAAYSSSTALQNNPPGTLAPVTGGSNARVSPLGVDEMRIIGEAQQQWAPLRRKYNLFLYHQTPNRELDLGLRKFNIPDANISKAQQMQLTRAAGQQAEGEFVQFAYVDEPFLSWDFSLRAADSQLIGSVNRNFAGFARELFTDTGVYALRMDAAALAEQRNEQQLVSQPSTAHTENLTGMTLDQRAVMLATAVSIDFDYFSRHSGTGVGFMPFWFPIGGAGEAAAGGAAAGEAGAAGTAVGEAATGAVGRAGAAGTMAEGAAAGAAGAGTIAGYEAMQRGMGDRGAVPPEQQSYEQSQVPPEEQQNASQELWNEDEDPWGHGNDPWGGGAGDDGGDGGDGDWF
ncbi:hypothetical protein Plec18167_008833 [Paecilomyces lecythidis]|uniref:Scramblase-domain-containing protein n=1 Tax=Paecilomyces lecythidis TaxID=3004212 RepID=A0ABR3WU97_9EURO